MRHVGLSLFRLSLHDGTKQAAFPPAYFFSNLPNFKPASLKKAVLLDFQATIKSL
jgi:hypothetical protein